MFFTWKWGSFFEILSPMSRFLRAIEFAICPRAGPVCSAHTTAWTRREVCTVGRQSHTRWGWGIYRPMHVLPYRCTANFSNTRHAKSVHQPREPGFCLHKITTWIGGGWSNKTKPTNKVKFTPRFFQLWKFKHNWINNLHLMFYFRNRSSKNVNSTPNSALPPAQPVPCCSLVA